MGTTKTKMKSTIPEQFFDKIFPFATKWGSKLVFAEAVFEGNIASVVMTKIFEKAKKTNFSSRNFKSLYLFSSLEERVKEFGVENLTNYDGILWYEGFPILVSPERASSGDVEDHFMGYEDEKSTFTKRTGYCKFSVFYIKGTFNPEKILKEAQDAANYALLNENVKQKFCINNVSGSAGNKLVQSKSGQKRRNDDTIAQPEILKINGIVPIGWSYEELYRSRTDQSYFCPQYLLDFEKKVEKWLSSKKWYKERTIPWKIGAVFSGAPGTGKSSYVSYLAKKHDIPLNIFDASSLTNEEFIENWKKVASNGPAIILLEDVAALFDKTKKLDENSDHVSFDCLLNCLDGAERYDGIFVVITTNHIDKIEPALLRPGRVDYAISFEETLDLENVKRFVSRILKDFSEKEISNFIEEVKEKTPAEIQAACVDYVMNNQEK